MSEVTTKLKSKFFLALVAIATVAALAISTERSHAFSVGSSVAKMGLKQSMKVKWRSFATGFTGNHGTVKLNGKKYPALQEGANSLAAFRAGIYSRYATLGTLVAGGFLASFLLTKDRLDREAEKKAAKAEQPENSSESQPADESSAASDGQGDVKQKAQSEYEERVEAYNRKLEEYEQQVQQRQQAIEQRRQAYERQMQEYEQAQAQQQSAR